jgi:hypothetical protein
VGELLKLGIPILSAIFIAWFAYFLSKRGKKHEIVTKEKIESAKALNKYLSDLEKYCYAKIGSIEVHEFSPYNAEKNGTPNSALGHRTNIFSIIVENKIFMEKPIKLSFEALDEQLNLLCNLELWMAGDMDIETKNILNPAGAYEATLSKIENCKKVLKSDLK